jgi:hypothetical protein
MAKMAKMDGRLLAPWSSAHGGIASDRPRQMGTGCLVMGPPTLEPLQGLRLECRITFQSHREDYLENYSKR